MGKTGKIANYEDIRQLPPKVRQMYIAVIQMLEEGADPANIRVSTITEKAGIGKGTAYEYFDSKEEIVAGAIVYQVQCVFDWLGSALEEKAGFREQIQFLLDEIEKKDGQKNCFFRFFHMMADNSEFSLLVREKMMTEAFLPGLPTSVFAKMLQRGVERGELRREIPMDYMIHCVFSHLLIYMLAITSGGLFRIDTASIRSMAYQGILNELEDRNNI